MTRRPAVVALLLAGLAPAAAGTQSPPPNIVFLFADDLGWTDLSTGRTNAGNGSGYYRTPHIDALALRGMSFDNAYSNGPNCAPTRAALMSGQHAARTGMYTVNSSNRGQSQYRLLEGAPNTTTVAPSVVTLAETLKAAGYATGHFGKWHLGDDSSGRGPLSQGFDVNRGGTAVGSVSGGSGGHFARSDGSWNLPYLPANGIANQFMADRLTDEALSWMGSVQGPFFCYLTQFSVHTPIQAPPADIAAFNGVPTTLYHRNQTYAGMLKNLDDNVGRIVSYLENTPDPARPGHMLVDNTVLIFYSDNGGLGGYATAGIAGGSEITHQFPLTSGKGSLFEGGIRVPLIVRWDGRVAPTSSSDVPIQSVDFHPTLAAIASANLPTGQVLDGVDFTPVLLGRATGLPRDQLFWHFPAYLAASSSLGTWRTTPGSLVRRGDFKLHFYYETRTWELFDLANDIGEHTNLAGAQPGLVTSMGGELRIWLAATGADLPRYKGTTTPVPLPLGTPATGDTVDWELHTTSTVPTAVHDHLLVADGSGVWSFGGRTDTAVIDELWRFDGSDWSRRSPGTSPAARSRHAGAWDAGRGRLVVFGGESATGALLDDTWDHGTAWSRVLPAVSPPARRDHAMAHDVAAGRTVLFGGEVSGGTRVNDTWTFDGTAWTQLTPASAPSARSGHALVHDPAGNTWLFGGVDASGALLTDTWRWDGANWTHVPTATTPPPRQGFALAWDAARSRAVLWGGRDAGGLPVDDTWEFDGTDWIGRDPTHRPLAGSGAAAAFDAPRSRVVVFGGFNGVASVGIWELRAAAPGVVHLFGTGCAGTAGTPRMFATSLPNLGARFDVDVASVPTGLVQVLSVMGLSDRTWAGGALPFALDALGAPTCSLLVRPEISSQQLSVGGRTRFSYPLPNDPRLLAVDLFLQAFVVDPGANALQLVVSNGMRATVGGG